MRTCCMCVCVRVVCVCVWRVCMWFTEVIVLKCSSQSSFLNRSATQFLSLWDAERWQLGFWVKSLLCGQNPTDSITLSTQKPLMDILDLL